MIKTLKLFLFLFLFSCTRGHLYVQQQWVDRDFLASTYVDTPDPRQEEPPIGQNLIVSWNFPHAFMKEKLKFNITVRFWDNTEEVISYPLKSNGGVKSFYFPDETPDKSNKILTYKVDVVTKDNRIIETWKHHFWTKLIDVDK